jgi:hypothetical protein
MSLHDADAGALLPDLAESKADTSNNPVMSLPNTASHDDTSEPHAPVITHYKKSPERKIAARSQKSNRVLQTSTKVSMHGASDTPTSTPLESRKKPEILDDEQGERSVKQEPSDTSPQDVKKSKPAKKTTLKRCDDSDDEVMPTETKSIIKKKKAAKHVSDSEGNGEEPKKKKRKTKVSALDTLGISDETMAQIRAGKSRKASGSKSVNAEFEDDDLDEDAENLVITQGSSGRTQGIRRLNHGDAARKTTQRIYSIKREPGHWPELCSLTQTKARNIHKKLRETGQTLLADVAEAICFPEDIPGVKPHNGYVSKTYLKSIAPGEYNEKGFIKGSSLKKLQPWQTEENIGVP